MYKTTIYLDDETKHKLDYLCNIENRKINNFITTMILRIYEEKTIEKSDKIKILKTINHIKGLTKETGFNREETHDDRIDFFRY